LIADLRASFNASFTVFKYARLLDLLEKQAGMPIEFRVAETPVFLPLAVLDGIAAAGAELTRRLLAWPEYLSAARASIPEAFRVADETAHPHFLTADFALIRDAAGALTPRLVEIQAFPSVFAYQAMLAEAYREVFELPEELGTFFPGIDEEGFWALMRQAIVGEHAPEHVVLTEVEPEKQKTLPDFLLTKEKLGIAVVDIAKLEPVGRKLHYRDGHGRLVRIDRIYNRAIADEMVAKQIQLPFDLRQSWDVEWAGHPNWYFLISKYSVPWLSTGGGVRDAASEVVPPAVFLDDFLEGDGRGRLEAAGVPLPEGDGVGAVYEELLLKPLFSFAGKGIQFAPSRLELESIAVEERKNYLLQQRMHFVPTIETPEGLTQAEIRILYIWPDGSSLTPVLPLVRLGRGKMMGVDHNRNQAWVGASAAFWR
jgi:hypothetical protein